jgi:hypothetical protein
VLELGLIKHIGDGTSTNIWNDRWIPDGIGFKPVYRKDGATAERVCDLFGQEGISWDDATLATILIPMDLEAIKRIPLGRMAEDIWTWSGE